MTMTRPVIVPELFALARNTDPQTSHEAAAKMNRTGATNVHADLVLASVASHPDSTAAEIGFDCGLGHHEAQRRLSDLLKTGRVIKGEPRVCRVKGNRMCTWGVV